MECLLWSRGRSGSGARNEIGGCGGGDWQALGVTWPSRKKSMAGERAFAMSTAPWTREEAWRDGREITITCNNARQNKKKKKKKKKKREREREEKEEE